MSTGLSCVVAAGPEEVEDGRGEPDDGRQEGEGDDSLELAAWVVAVQANVAPVERGATRTSIEILRGQESATRQAWRESGDTGMRGREL